MCSVIESTLKEIGLFSSEAVSLLMGTAAQESGFGRYIKQIKGPALGIFQIEPNTFNSICNDFLAYNDDLRFLVWDVCNIREFDAQDLDTNLELSICFARLKYYTIPASIPTDLDGQAAYWKKYYNTIYGAGTVDEYISNYNKFIDYE